MSSDESESQGEQPAGPKDDNFRFQVGQKVFCYHGPLMYDARCVQQSMRHDEPFYLIHYHGWNKNWDEWVDESRVMEHTPETVKLAEEMKKQSKAEKKAGMGMRGQKRKAGMMSETETPEVELQHRGRGPGSSGRSATRGKTTDPKEGAGTSGRGRGTLKGKRKRNSLRDLEPSTLSKHNSLKVTISDTLKSVLLDDMYLVTKERRLSKLPPHMTVADLLNEYVRDRTALCTRIPKREDGSPLTEQDANQIQSEMVRNIRLNVKDNEDAAAIHSTAFHEVAKGLRVYFNSVLSSQLLYKQERVQYKDIKDLIDADNFKENRKKGKQEPEKPEKPDKQHHRQRKHSTAPVSGSSAPADSEEGNNSKSETDGTKGDRKKTLRDLASYYPPIFMLRLFTKISNVLSHVPMEASVSMMIKGYFNDVIEYMDEQKARLFSTTHYAHMTAEYVRRYETAKF